MPSGFDIYAPTQSVIAHEYERKYAVKFWESVQLTYGSATLYNDLNNLTIQRVQHLLGFPEALHPSQLDPPVLMTCISEYGLGVQRSLNAFLKWSGLNVVRKVHTIPPWCNSKLQGDILA